MRRLVCSILLALVSWSVFAQSSGATEPPQEHASLVTVAIFVAVFIASCVGWFAYTWWDGKKKTQQSDK